MTCPFQVGETYTNRIGSYGVALLAYEDTPFTSTFQMA
jgi:hypothetical protein